MNCKQVSIVAELLHFSIYLLRMSTLLSVYLFNVLAFQHKLILVHMISHFSVLSLPFITFTGGMLQHLQCSLAPAVGRMLQQLQRSACMYLFSSHRVYLRQKPKQITEVPL